MCINGVDSANLGNASASTATTEFHVRSHGFQISICRITNQNIAMCVVVAAVAVC